MKIKLTREGGFLKPGLLFPLLKLFLFLFCAKAFAFAPENSSFQNTHVEIHQSGTYSVKEVFELLKKQTEYTFIYRDELIEDLPATRLEKGRILVDELLKKCLPSDSFSFQIGADQSVIIKKSVNSSVGLYQRQVSGTVVDDTGVPLPGVTVMEKGTSNGVATDFNGSYQITVPENSTLVFTYIGYEPQEVEVGEQQEINVQLTLAVSDLDEVVLNGYQKIDRELFTGAASIVKAEDAKIDGVVDVSRSLQGRAAGVQVQNVSGTFGASPKIRVRGSSSIYGNSNPLWVVDGVVLEDVVEISADDLASGNAITLIGSSIAGLNADDIASFQILKDASATAIYGARAMNGVIMILTKRGKSGEVRMNYTSELTLKTKPSYANYDIMNSQQQMGVYLDMQDKGLLNHAEISRTADGGVFNKMYNLVYDYDPVTDSFALDNTPEARNAYLRQAEMRNTDWFDELFRNSIQQNHSVSMSGGNERSSFYASVSFLNDPGWTVSDHVDRFTANLNSTIRLNEWAEVNILTNNSIRLQQVPGALDREMNVVSGEYNRNFDINPFSYALNASRTMAAYDANGNYEWYKMNYAPFSILNESANNYIDIDNLDSKIQGSIKIDLMDGWDVTALGALRYVKATREHKITENSNLANAYRAAEDATIAQGNQFLYQDPENPAMLPEVVLPAGGFYNRDDNTLLNYYFRLTSSFNRRIKEKHNVNALVGQEIRYADRTYSFNKGYGYQWGKGGTPFVDYRILKQMLESGFQYYGMDKNYDRFVAFFSSLGYSYDDRYTINLTGRYDGSNRLGQSRSARWLPTWNVSGAWHVDREEFMYNQDVISRLNLRATYGLTASMGPASSARAIYLNEIAFRPYQEEKENQIVIAGLENQDLTWEKQYETNIGLDLGLFNNRISLSSDIYRRDGFDLIGFVRTSGVGGELFKAANYADMKSHGVEFTLNTQNIVSKGFNWSTNFTFAHNKNEITRLGASPRVIDLVREEGGPLEGYPVNSLFSIPFEGLNDEGFPTFQNGYGEVTQAGVDFQGRDLDFLKYEGSIDPTYSGGVENSFSYKGFNLGVFITYQGGNKIRLNPGFSHQYSDVQSMSKDMLDRWMMPGDEALTDIPTIPSARQLRENFYLQQSYNAYNYSSARVADGDFIRLRDITFGYTFSRAVLDQLGIKSLQARLTANNLVLLYSDDKLNGQDPEFFRAGGVAMPVPRQFTFSLKVGL